MAKDPAFLFYYKDVLVSCADWDADSLGWYTRLLCHQADKQEGLPADIESLASLAGVKFSQYDRFVSCWKRTLEAKFEANDQGLLINKVQDDLLIKRRKYKENQAKRGLVGAFVKKIRQNKLLQAPQIADFVPILFDTLHIENTKEENEDAFKRTLEAYIGNANANGIGNINTDQEEGGTGEDWGCRPTASVPLPMHDQEITGTVEFIYRLKKQMLTSAQVNEFWEAFRILQFNGEKFYQTRGDAIAHFRNWLKQQDGTNKKTSGTISNGKPTPGHVPTGGFGFNEGR